MCVEQTVVEYIGTFRYFSMKQHENISSYEKTVAGVTGAYQVGDMMDFGCVSDQPMGRSAVATG